MKDLHVVIRVLILPIVAVASLAVATVVPVPDADSPRSPGRVDATHARYACPVESGGSVALGQWRPGTSVTATILPDSSSLEVDPGQWVVAKPEGDAVVVDHRGSRSGPAGFFARTAASSAGGGLMVGECPSTLDDAWFVGLGSGGKHQSSLVFTNVGDTPAVVDVHLWRPDGEVEAVGADGIVIEPLTTRRVKLSDVAAGELELAAHVHRTRGAVSVVALDSSTATFKGSEVVTAVEEPSRDQVLTGVTKGASGRSLIVLNPNPATARVKVAVVGPQGTFVPDGLESIKLGPQQLAVVDVPRSAGSDQLAVHLVSDLPVVAAVRLNPSTGDFAYAEATPVLTGSAIIPVQLGASSGTPELVVAAVGAKASVTIEAFDEKMTSLKHADVEIAKDATRAIDLRKAFDVDKIAYFVVTPTGPVRAAATYVDAQRIASLALADLPLTITAPEVRPAP